MDFNTNKTEIRAWILLLDILKNSKFKFKEEKNFHDIQTITIDIESENNLGLIIIYQDNNLFFDFMSKKDPEMRSFNWSDYYEDFNQMQLKIEEALVKYWKN